jgi:predicted PurR-regulated permease PerM
MQRMEDKLKTVALFVLLLIFAYLSYLLISPFFSAILLGVIFAFLSFPLYVRLSKKTNLTLAAVITLVLLLLVIILPSIWLTASLLTQASNAYQLVQSHGINSTAIFDRIQTWTSFDVTEPYNAAVEAGKGAAAAAIPGVITSTSNIIVGFIIFLFVFYYALKDGRDWFRGLGAALPIHRKYRKQLQDDVESMTKALFYGQVLTAVLIGILCGAILAILGVPNAIFWGFVMVIFSFLPILGAPIVYIPAGIILMLNGNWVSGILIIVLCAAIQLTIDYVVRPKFIGKQAEIHPLIVIIGALGGIMVFGFIGFLIGPLILGLFVRLLTFDYGIRTT